MILHVREVKHIPEQISSVCPGSCRRRVITGPPSAGPCAVSMNPRPVTPPAYARGAPGHPHLRAPGALRRGRVLRSGAVTRPANEGHSARQPRSDAVRRRSNIECVGHLLDRRRCRLYQGRCSCVACLAPSCAGPASFRATPARLSAAPRRRSVLRIRRRPLLAGLPRPFGDGGTRHTSAGPREAAGTPPVLSGYAVHPGPVLIGGLWTRTARLRPQAPARRGGC